MTLSKAASAQALGVIRVQKISLEDAAQAGLLGLVLFPQIKALLPLLKSAVKNRKKILGVVQAACISIAGVFPGLPVNVEAIPAAFDAAMNVFSKKK